MTPATEFAIIRSVICIGQISDQLVEALPTVEWKCHRYLAFFYSKKYQVHTESGMFNTLLSPSPPNLLIHSKLFLQIVKFVKHSFGEGNTYSKMLSWKINIIRLDLMVTKEIFVTVVTFSYVPTVSTFGELRNSITFNTSHLDRLANTRIQQYNIYSPGGSGACALLYLVLCRQLYQCYWARPQLKNYSKLRYEFRGTGNSQPPQWKEIPNRYNESEYR